MENQLAVLISAYEDERSKLQIMLNEYLNDVDTDYLSAHYCSISLSQNNDKLQVLKRLDDPLYNEKYSQLQSIAFYKKLLASEAADVMKEYLEKRISKAEQELERLNQIPKHQGNGNDLSIVDTFLVKLLNNRLTNSELILNKKHNLILRFRYSKKLLTIKIPFLKKHIAKDMLDQNKIRWLKKIGFQVAKDENHLVLFLSGEKNEILNQIKSVLAEIVFDVFHYSEFQNETFLRFVEKT